jgi:hypothetical protein
VNVKAPVALFTSVIWMPEQLLTVVVAVTSTSRKL